MYLQNESKYLFSYLRIRQEGAKLRLWIDYLLKRVQKSWIKRYMIICPHLTSVANVWLRNFVTTTHEFRLSQQCVLRLHGKWLHSSSTHPSCKVTLSDWGHVEHRTLKKSRCVVCLFNKHIQILNIQCISKFSPLSGRKKCQWHQQKMREKWILG